MKILLSILIVLPLDTLAAPAVCPPEGDAVQAEARELNPLKRRMELPGALDPGVTLVAMLAPGDDEHRWNTKDGARIEGYVVNVKPGGIESVNCHARAVADRDTHIEIALTANAPETERVVVEVTPQVRKARHPDWTTPELKKLIGKRVRVTGWLFFDAEHKAESAHTCTHCAHAWRATAWELHPVTAIEILPLNTI